MATGGSGGIGGEGGAFIGSGPNPDGPFGDFPKAPVIEGAAPADAPKIFETPAQPSGGPCLAEPTLEALVPTNWTPLRFEWSAPPSQTLFELRLSVDNQVNELVVYTDQPSYTIPADVWKDLAPHSAGRDLKVKLKGAQTAAGTTFVGAEGVVHIAPVAAPGSIVYWTTGADGTQTALKGFTIGDSELKTVVTPALVGEGTTCVGCHSSAPNGKLTFFARNIGLSYRSIAARGVDGTAKVPSAQEMSPVAAQLLNRHNQNAPVLSEAHYGANDAFAVTVFVDAGSGVGQPELIWTDLHATDPAAGWGILARTGDTRRPGTPTFWHDGTTIAYTSSVYVGDGVISGISDADQVMDIYTVPWNDHQGGPATPLPGASDPAYLEFYPVISPNDTLLAFTRIAPYKQPNNEWADSYDEPQAEIFVVPAKGGTAVRVAGNDPPACVSKPSPGITNSWPRWAPSAESVGGKRYYWLTFSSKRREANNPQLFVSGVVTKIENGAEVIDKTYPAIYVTSQIPEENNHTPAWDVFEINPPK